LVGMAMRHFKGMLAKKKKEKEKRLLACVSTSFIVHKFWLVDLQNRTTAARVICYDKRQADTSQKNYIQQVYYTYD
jgi:hypothetical protein